LVERPEEPPDWYRLQRMERTAELRSRVALLRASSRHLHASFSSVFKSHLAKRRTPPFLNPEPTFKKLEAAIEDLAERIEKLDPFGPTYYPELSLDCTDYERNILVLQKTFLQRSLGLGTSNLVEFHPVSQEESGWMCKVYEAIDSLAYDLMTRIMGTAGEEGLFYPISCFEESYASMFPTEILTIPYHDTFRARFWPILAHEIAHVGINRSLGVDDEFRNFMYDASLFMLRACFDLRLLKLPEEKLEGLRRVASSQIVELMCDIVAAYVTGPAYFFASANLLLNVVGSSLRRHHPSDRVRLSCIADVLEKNGFTKCTWLWPYIEAIKDYENRLEEVVIEALSRGDERKRRLLSERVRAYADFAAKLSTLVLDDLESSSVRGLACRKYEIHSWRQMIEGLGSSDDVVLTPVDVLNADWLKRIGITMRQSRWRIDRFLDARRDEPKIFEFVVRSCHKYYSRAVLKETPRSV